MEEQNVKLQQEVRQYVHSTGRWYQFFGVVSIVGASLMVLMALVMFFAGGLMNEALAESGQQFPAWVLGVIYVLSAACMIPMIIFMMRGAKAAKEATGLHNNDAAVRFFYETKRYWKFYGILTIVLLGLTILVVPVATVIGVAIAF